MDRADGMEYEPTQPSISQLRQQQKSDRSRKYPSKEPSSYSQRAASIKRGSISQGKVDENSIRQIIAEQLQKLVSPLIEMVNEAQIIGISHLLPFENGSERAIWFDINSSLSTNAKQKARIFNANGPNIKYDYNQFIAYLKRSFGNRKEKGEKQELLSKIRQRENQRFSDFFPLFEEALIGSGGTGWPNDSKFIWLRLSLSESLRDQLFTVNLNPHDFYESVGKIEEVAYRFEQSRHFKGRKGCEQRLKIPRPHVVKVRTYGGYDGLRF
ncbi:putative eka-like protein [Golovinomyces cichoracearum]|uniref:Putative eka-like protein n=1 Tax=Golovinomyces cichoracearum TaxID=62708 RepID=A0A420J3B3_9PEZI|nr:putative eka-like protein [Golovinomyces cichoracearum]